MENECREDGLQNAKHRLPDCFLYMKVVVYLLGRISFARKQRYRLHINTNFINAAKQL
nr:hypothetical protein [Ruminococcus bromii]